MNEHPVIESSLNGLRSMMESLPDNQSLRQSHDHIMEHREALSNIAHGYEHDGFSITHLEHTPEGGRSSFGPGTHFLGWDRKSPRGQEDQAIFSYHPSEYIHTIKKSYHTAIDLLKGEEEPSGHRVFMRRSDLEEVKGSWGNKESYHVHKENRNIVKGEFVGTHELPEVLYHVTTNVPGILASGHLKAGNDDKSGGLGGSRGTGRAVSFTSSRHDALNIHRELLRSGEIARGETGPQHFHLWARADEKAHGLPEGHLHRAAKLAEDTFNFHRENYPDQDLTEHMLDAHRMYRVARATDGGPEDPVIFGRAASFAKIHPEHTGIIAVHREDIPHEPLTRVNPDNSRTDFLHEVQVHGDVPLSSKSKVMFHDGRAPYRIGMKKSFVGDNNYEGVGLAKSLFEEKLEKGDPGPFQIHPPHPQKPRAPRTPYPFDPLQQKREFAPPYRFKPHRLKDLMLLHREDAYDNPRVRKAPRIGSVPSMKTATFRPSFSLIKSMLRELNIHDETDV